LPEHAPQANSRCGSEGRLPPGAECGLDSLDPTTVNVFFAFGRDASYQWRPEPWPF